MQPRLLEVNDVLYRYSSSGRRLTKLTVIRVTPTQAVTNDGTKVKRLLQKNTFSDGYNASVITSMYGGYSLSVETPEIIAEFEKGEKLQSVDAALRNLNTKELDMQHLTKLHECLIEITHNTNTTT